MCIKDQLDTPCKSSKEIRKRLVMAKSIVQSMLNIWKSSGVSTKLKLWLLHATAFAVASYGCESWNFTEIDGEKIFSFEMRCYIRLLRVSWTEKRTHQWVLDKIGTSPVMPKKHDIEDVFRWLH